MEKIIRETREDINRKNKGTNDEEVLAFIANKILTENKYIYDSFDKKRKTIEQVFYAIRKDLDILYPYAIDDSVSEIMVNGKDNIFIERKGQLIKSEETFSSTEALEEVIRRIAGKVHREINELTPIVDARLEDGSRVNAVYKNIAINGPILTIRKFPKKAITMENLIKNQTITQEAAAFMKKIVESGYNCFISGGTSSGKTTFLNVLSNYIPKEERVIVIEDSAELQIQGIDNIVRLECKNANVQGVGQIDMCQLIKTSLRMRPDRIIVGEVRGKEVMDMINSMNTGHDGSMSTGHGNSIEGMLRRLEAMFLQAADFPIDAIRSQIAEGIDLIVHLGRMMDKKRKVLDISEIVGIENDKFIINTIYKYNINKGLLPTGNKLINTFKLEMKGFNKDD